MTGFIVSLNMSMRISRGPIGGSASQKEDLVVSIIFGTQLIFQSLDSLL